MMAMDQARNTGFTQMIAPSLVKPRAMEGTGFLGQAADDVYRIEGQDLYLVGTSEVAMAAYHSDEILDAGALPLRYAAFSPCFRKEAGSHGKDTRGIFRVHWFDKVEMFVYTTMEDSFAEHRRLLEWEKEFLDKLELHYRVIDVAAGDLGLSAQRKFDCEAWIASQGRFRELTSTSNCTDFQTRRLDTRGRFADGKRRAGRHPQRHALLDQPPDHRPARDPPAGRRFGPGAAGAAALSRRAGRHQAGHVTGRLAAAARRTRYRRHAAEVGGGLRADLRAGRAGRLRRRAPRPRCRRPRRTGQRPLPARHDLGRRPPRPAAA